MCESSCCGHGASGKIRWGAVLAVVAGIWLYIEASGKDAAKAAKEAPAAIPAPAPVAVPVSDTGISWGTVAVTAAVVLAVVGAAAFAVVQLRRRRARRLLLVKLQAQRALTARPAGVRRPPELPGRQSAQEWLSQADR
jgi:hypothetical protein